MLTSCVVDMAPQVIARRHGEERQEQSHAYAVAFEPVVGALGAE